MNETQELPLSPLQPLVYTRSEHNISRQNIDPDALKIMYRLLRHGYKAFMVGGGVRDLLLNKKPKDFDISTDATPRRIKSLFRNSRIIGRRFKLVHVFFRGNRNIEVSTFRAAGEPQEDSDNGAQNNHDNIYGDESTDALRRDLTINGLFYDLANFSVIDYVGGMQDLRNRVIRVIGDPDKRFKEDPVRLLRVVRHAARNDFEIEPNCWQSLLRNHDLIAESSPVRVYEETKKDLTCGHLLKILRLLSECGLLKQLLPELDQRRDIILRGDHPFAQAIGEADRLVQAEEAPSPTVILALMVLLFRLPAGFSNLEVDDREVGDLVADTFTVLQVPRKERERIEQLLRAYINLAASDHGNVRIGHLAKKPYFSDLTAFAKILSVCSTNDALIELLAKAEHAKSSEADTYASDDRPRRRRSRPRGGRRRRPGEREAR